MSLDLSPGDRYGRFTIQAELGSGGFGRVYKVTDPRYDVPLALKLSNDPIADPKTAQRALREVTVQRRYQNPYTVSVLDCGLNRDGHVFLLMELLDGLPLHDFHAFGRPLHPLWVCHIGYECCLALATAHDEGVVHRDLKPSNIFIDRQGHTKVLDFGLARSWDSSQSIVGRSATVGPMLAGTPHYAQPEQLLARDLTPAADIYSLAMIMYELLCGHSPLVAGRSLPDVVDEWFDKPLLWLRAHEKNPVVPLRTYLGPDALSDELARLVESGLAKDPQERPPGARAFGEHLRRLWPG